MESPYYHYAVVIVVKKLLDNLAALKSNDMADLIERQATMKE